jgi:acyl carrier protein
MKDQIEAIIIECLQDLNDDIESESLENPNKDTKIFGEDGVLDSLALVSLISDLEEEIHDRFDKDVTLADEKAMSQRRSPFGSVESLTEYIDMLING